MRGTKNPLAPPKALESKPFDVGSWHKNKACMETWTYHDTQTLPRNKEACTDGTSIFPHSFDAKRTEGKAAKEEVALERKKRFAEWTGFRGGRVPMRERWLLRWGLRCLVGTWAIGSADLSLHPSPFYLTVHSLLERRDGKGKEWVVITCRETKRKGRYRMNESQDRRMKSRREREGWER